MDETDLVASRRYLSHIGVWPSPKQLDVEAWLENFDSDVDRAIALALLESYVHINEEQIAYATCSTIRSISSRPEFGAAPDRQANWKKFNAEVLISFPLGGGGDSTASGYIFARIASQLGIPESRIIDAEHLVGRISAAEQPKSVVFLDDLAASGTQFCRSWRRTYISDGVSSSMEDLAHNDALSRIYYLPIVSTQAAKTKIENESPAIVVPTYLLDDDYGALAHDTRLVPKGLQGGLRNFLEKYGPRTGMAQFGTAGYGNLGLALSFHHGSPNNTLPELQWGVVADNWNPLVVKSI